jgi:chromatin remodeling complex protein RSC6
MPRKANPALLAPREISPELEAVVGKGPMPRGQITKKLWEYIKGNGLQDKEKGRIIHPDAKLGAVLGTTDAIDMLQMTGKVSKHIK